jgi:hypothetical protein
MAITRCTDVIITSTFHHKFISTMSNASFQDIMQSQTPQVCSTTVNSTQPCKWCLGWSSHVISVTHLGIALKMCYITQNVTLPMTQSPLYTTAVKTKYSLSTSRNVYKYHKRVTLKYKEKIQASQQCMCISSDQDNA